MNITTKIIITDTNIITDLDNANILDKFVELENVYICDMVKRDEIKSSTGNIKIINKFKTIEVTSNQLLEIDDIVKNNKKLSPFDIINFLLARDNNAILATGDKRLGTFSEENGVEVIRTLKIINLMTYNNYISNNDAINACILLKKNNSTRIPPDEIDKTIEKLKKESVVC